MTELFEKWDRGDSRLLFRALTFTFWVAMLLFVTVAFLNHISGGFIDPIVATAITGGLFILGLCSIIAWMFCDNYA